MEIKEFPQETQPITPEEKDIILETLSKYLPLDKEQKNLLKDVVQQVKQETNNDLGLRVNMGMYRGEIEIYRDMLVLDNRSGKEVEKYTTEDNSHLYTKDIEQAYQTFDLMYQGYSKYYIFKIIRLRRSMKSNK